MNEIVFDKKAKLILVEVSIKNDKNIVDGVFVLDTGCSTTVINPDFLERCKYSKNEYIEEAFFTTGSKKEKGNLLKIQTIKALGLMRRNFEIISYELPSVFFFNGLLGLDFIKNKDLLISYKKGTLRLD
jgi:hypothetical protein